ncbi:hypothetical protein LINPERPRIM_LOCUS21837 [Linum perenne]
MSSDKRAHQQTPFAHDRSVKADHQQPPADHPPDPRNHLLLLLKPLHIPLPLSPPLLLLSLVENGAHLFTTFIDRDPSLKFLLSHLNLAGHHLHRNPNNAALPRLHRRCSFLHLTRVGTLDDDFFSDDDDSDRSLFGPNQKIPPNGSSLILNTFHPRVGFSDFVVDNGIRVSEIVRFEVQFKVEEAALQFEDSEIDYGDQQDDDNGSMGLQKDRIVDFQSFGVQRS